MSKVVRKALAILLACLPLAALGIVSLTLRAQLGSELATHWSGDATVPDGFSSTWGSFWTFAGITAGLTVAAVAATLVCSRFRPGRIWATLATVTSGFTAIAWIVSAWATADAPTPAEANLGARLVVMLSALGLGALTYFVAPVGPALGIDPDVTPRSMALQPGERVAWSTTISSPMFAWIGIALAVGSAAIAVGAVSSGDDELFIGTAALAVSAISVLALTPVRLAVDHRGVRLTSLVFGFPLIRAGLSTIESVTTDAIEPLQWGGWGYRVSGQGRAYIARRGPGIIIHRRNGSAIAITVPNPSVPAETANALAGRLLIKPN
jgi:hypothetical protein